MNAVAATDFGDVPTWLGALASAGALLAAVVAAIFAGRVYRIESARDQLAVMDRLKTQAGLVVAWVTKTDDGWLAVVRNNSSLPVFEVSVRVIGQKVGGSPPPFADLATKDLPVLPPGEETIVVGTEPVGVALKFRDTAYNYWVRHMHGGLILQRRGTDPDDDGSTPLSFG